MSHFGYKKSEPPFCWSNCLLFALDLESGELDLGKKLYAQMMSFSSADSGRHAVFSQLDPQQILALINVKL